jgi:hypothetical protein
MPVGRMPSTPNAALLSDLKATVNAISMASHKALRADAVPGTSY